MITLTGKIILDNGYDGALLMGVDYFGKESLIGDIIKSEIDFEILPLQYLRSKKLYKITIEEIE
jgi:hypothetical protein